MSTASLRELKRTRKVGFPLAYQSSVEGAHWFILYLENLRLTELHRTSSQAHAGHACDPDLRDMYRMYEITLDGNDNGAKLIGNLSGVGVFTSWRESTGLLVSITEHVWLWGWIKDKEWHMTICYETGRDRLVLGIYWKTTRINEVMTPHTLPRQ